MTTKMKYLLTLIAIAIAGVILYNSVSYVPAGPLYGTVIKKHHLKYGVLVIHGNHCTVDVVVTYSSVSDELKERELLVKLDQKVLDLIAENGDMCDLDSLEHLRDLIIQKVDFLKIVKVVVEKVGHDHTLTSEWDIKHFYPSPSHSKTLDSVITLSMKNAVLYDLYTNNPGLVK